MKIKLIFLSFLIINTISAYDLKKINIEPRNYFKYIKPQLINISNDYENFLEKVEPNQKKYIKLRSPLIKLIWQVSTYLDKCSLITEDCLEDLKSFNALFEIYIKKVNESELDIDSLINSLNHYSKTIIEQKNFFTKVFNYNLNLKYLIHQVSLFPHRKYNLLILKNDLLEIYDIYHRSISYLMPQNIQEDIRFGQIFFFKTIDTRILADEKYELLKVLINELNNSWHEMNVQLYKRKQSISQISKNQLNTINNRWISILKMIVE